jgi:hypothetical protein
MHHQINKTPFILAIHICSHFATVSAVILMAANAFLIEKLNIYGVMGLFIDKLRVKSIAGVKSLQRTTTTVENLFVRKKIFMGNFH